MEKLVESFKKVVLAGSGGHSKVIIDTLRKYSDYEIVGITEKDENRVGENVLGVPVIGTDEELEALYSGGVCRAFISLGMIEDYKPRLRLYKKLSSIGFELINVIHGRSIISEYASIGKGNAVLAGAIINTEASLGDNCIVNTGSIIEHDCVIGNNVHIAPGAKLSGQVTIGDNTMVGAGSVVIQGINIGENCLIGAGSVVTRDIPSNSVAYGIPAKIIRER